MTTELLTGGRIYSPSAPDATAMAVTDGVVSWIGESRTGRALHPEARIVDLAGAFVAPAFVDSHVHTTDLGLALTSLNLSACTSLEQCLAAIRDHAARSDDEVIWGHGWDESVWPEHRAPTTAEIDAAASGRAVYLARADAHSAVASTVLRARCAGLDTAAGFSPEAPLTTAAHHAVRRAARDALSTATRARARAAALDRAAELGIVAVHECAGPDITGLVDFRELLATDHGVEVRGYWGEAVSTDEQARHMLADTGAHALGGDLFVDGSIGSHTAWLSSDYCDASGTGVAYESVDSIASHISACTRAGIQSGFHVIGDNAVAAAVAAFERVVAELGGPAVAACGHRLEHVEMVERRQAEALASWGVIVSSQPSFDAIWGGPEGMYATRLGVERASALNPLSQLAAAGVSLAFGSDAPVTSLDPWATLRAAVNHRTAGSAISPRAAFSAATRGAWRAGGVRDGLAGTLVPGAPASYAVWDAEDLVVRAPKDSVQRWSTDPRAGVAPLPALEPESPSPVCLKSVHRGRTVHER